MTPTQMLARVQRQLAIDLNCEVGDLNGEKDGLVFVSAKQNPGRRPFPRGEQHFEMVTMGNAIVVSASCTLLEEAKKQLQGKTRDDAFSAPFVYGHAIYYLPDLGNSQPLSAPLGFTYQMYEQGDIANLYNLEGFSNALGYDINHLRPDVIALLAKEGENIVAIAGASADCQDMWQIGIDVKPPYRHRGLAAYLTNALAHEILCRDKVPYYGTSSSNIASQRVAHRAHLTPAWMCVYKTRFALQETLPTG